ncbi:unnamed protein product [Closterium sp. Yama58-4]|nr:unnamed protein product [Closterium sp. Yama58-4]
MSTTRFLSALLAILALSCLAADARKLQEADPAVPAVEPQTVETTPLPGTPKLASIAVAPNAKATSPIVPTTTTAPTPKGKALGGKVAPAGGKQPGPGAPKQGTAGGAGAPKTHPAPVPRGAEHKGKPLGHEVMQVGTVLRGSSVVGAAPGDANAAGNAIMTVYKNGPVVNIKYVVAVRKLSVAGLPTGATINMAASDATGPAVISFAGAKWVNTTGIGATASANPAENYLSYATTGVWEDVANMKALSGQPLSTTFSKVMFNPEKFYVVVSTPAFPAGAVRGQLRKGTGATVLPPGHRKQMVLALPRHISAAPHLNIPIRRAATCHASRVSRQGVSSRASLVVKVPADRALAAAAGFSATVGFAESRVFGLPDTRALLASQRATAGNCATAGAGSRTAGRGGALGVKMVLTESQPLALGTRAPDFTLVEPLTGKTWSLSDFDGHPALLVMFICNHCPFVVHIKSQLVALGNDYISKHGLGVVAISSNSVLTHPQDGPDKMAEEAKQFNFPFPYLYDETQEVAKAYHAACTPDFFLFKKDGRRPLELAYHGQLDDSRPSNGRPVTGKDLRTALDCVLSARPVPSAQRPSIGCNIKWAPGNEPGYFG